LYVRILLERMRQIDDPKVPPKLAVVPELLHFALVGAVGFFVNAIAVTAASCVVDLYTTGAIGLLVAVTDRDGSLFTAPATPIGAQQRGRPMLS
jgi:hypothetical protein